MHDIRFAKEIHRVVSEKMASLEKGAVIKAINVRLSPFSHVRPETLAGSFKLEVLDTALEHIPLKVMVIDIKGRCGGCGNEFIINMKKLACPKCGGADIATEHVAEFYVESIEVEKAG